MYVRVCTFTLHIDAYTNCLRSFSGWHALISAVKTKSTKLYTKHTFIITNTIYKVFFCFVRLLLAILEFPMKHYLFECFFLFFLFMFFFVVKISKIHSTFIRLFVGLLKLLAFIATLFANVYIHTRFCEVTFL